jgi:hypothetical protein
MYQLGIFGQQNLDSTCFNMFQPNHPGLGTTQIWSLVAHPQLTSVKCRWFSAENAGIPQGASPMVFDMVPLVWIEA